MPQATVLCFGTFDGLHNGHEYFLKQARSLGSRLVVSVARDEHVRILKNKEPKHDQTQRLQQICDLAYVDECRLSDQELGSYLIVDDVKPDVIAIGHDQARLMENCVRWLDQHHPEIQIKQIDYLDAEKIPLKLD